MQFQGYHCAPARSSSEVLGTSFSKHLLMGAFLQVLDEPCQDIIQVEGLRVFCQIRLASLHRVHQSFQASLIILRRASQLLGEFQGIHNSRFMHAERAIGNKLSSASGQLT